MTQNSDSSQNNTERPRPSLGEQLRVTLVILLGAGGVFGGIWLLDAIAH